MYTEYLSCWYSDLYLTAMQEDVVSSEISYVIDLMDRFSFEFHYRYCVCDWLTG